MSEKEPKARDGVLQQHMPERWKAVDGQGLASAYVMPGTALADVSPPFGVDLGSVCVVMGWLGLPRLSAESAFIHDPEGGPIAIGVGGQVGERRDPAPCSIFVTQLEAQDHCAAVIAARDRIHEAVGLISAVESMVLVLEHVEDYTVDFSQGGTLGSVSRQIANSLWWHPPSLEPEARQRWELAAAALAASPAYERIALSLRWFDQAKRTSGVDAFIRFWLALETLSGAERDEKVVRLLRDALARIYGIGSAEAGTRFGLGRIYGLRNLIFHHGLRVDVPPLLLGYLGSVYLDVLTATLGFSTPGRAMAALDEAQFVDNLLPAAVGGVGEQYERERERAAMEELKGEGAEDGEDRLA